MQLAGFHIVFSTSSTPHEAWLASVKAPASGGRQVSLRRVSLLCLVGGIAPVCQAGTCRPQPRSVSRSLRLWETCTVKGG